MTVMEALPELSKLVGKRVDIYRGHAIGVLQYIAIGYDDVYYVVLPDGEFDEVWYSAVGHIEEVKDDTV